MTSKQRPAKEVAVDRTQRFSGEKHMALICKQLRGLGIDADVAAFEEAWKVLATKVYALPDDVKKKPQRKSPVAPNSIAAGGNGAPNGVPPQIPSNTSVQVGGIYLTDALGFEGGQVLVDSYDPATQQVACRYLDAYQQPQGINLTANRLGARLR